MRLRKRFKVWAVEYTVLVFNLMCLHWTFNGFRKWIQWTQEFFENGITGSFLLRSKTIFW